jgi:2-oxoglutarate ferredoxin oxidoreductase subunit alpha
MRLNILIGGKAGQGLNKIAEILSVILAKHGYFSFNYRDYPSLIRGGHNFNIVSVSDKRVGSYEKEMDIIVALDENTLEVHKKELKKSGIILSYSDFKEDLGRNLNIALAGSLIRILGIEKDILLNEIEETFHNKETVAAAEKGFNMQKEKYKLKKIKREVKIMNGAQAVEEGAINSGIDFYLAYPMTPATSLLHELAGKQLEHDFRVFQPENELAVVNMALGVSFTGKKTMIGTSGGGFDLMTESLSMQGVCEIPLIVYLASRPGPGTGVPTYNLQGDLNIALKGGHGEAPRVVIAPGDPLEAIEKTNEAFYLAEKFNTLSIILSDKHLAESGFSFEGNHKNILKVSVKRDIPGKKVVRGNSYEHDEHGHTTENPEIIKKMSDKRLEKYEKIREEAGKFEMIKIYGDKKSKNLVIGWGSNKGVILDAIDGLDCKFLHVLYMKPMSDEIKKELEKAKNIILVETNLTGLLGRLVREKTRISIKNRILKYDTLPFQSDELKKQIKKFLK